MRHDPFTPERHENRHAAHDPHDDDRAKRTTKQAQQCNDQQQRQRKMSGLEPLDDKVGARLQWSPDLDRAVHATDPNVDGVEHA
jgi:hypothetical protein